MICFPTKQKLILNGTVCKVMSTLSLWRKWKVVLELSDIDHTLPSTVWVTSFPSIAKTISTHFSGLKQRHCYTFQQLSYFLPLM